MDIIVKPQQTLADIAVQVYGDVQAVILIAAENKISITNELQSGMILKCPDKVFDKYLQDYVRNKQISPATAGNIE